MSLKSLARTAGIAATGVAMLAGTAFMAAPANAATSTTTTNSLGCAVVTTPGGTQHFAAKTHDNTTTTKHQAQEQQSRWTFTPSVTSYLNQYKYQKQQALTEYSATIPGTTEVTKDQVQYEQPVSKTRLIKPGSEAQFETLYSFSANAQKYERQNQGHAATSHEEYQYKQTSIVYTIEHKQVTYTGNQGNVISWLNANGTQVSAGVWSLKDSVVAAAHVNPLTIAQSGSVDLSAYGGPNVTVHYNIVGVDISTTPPSGSFVESQTPQTVYLGANGQIVATAAQAAWLTASPGGAWVQFNQKSVSNNDGVAPFEEYLEADGTTVTTNPAQAGLLVTAPTTGGWTAFGSPVKVYRAQNGSSTTDANSEGWFPSSTAPAPWTQDSSKQSQTQAATPDEYLEQDGTTETTDINLAGYFDVTQLSAFVAAGWSAFGATQGSVEYLHDNGDGTYSWADTPDGLSWVDEDLTTVNVSGVGPVTLSTLVKLTDPDGNVIINKVVVTPGTPDQTIYLKADAQGNLSTTTDPNQATWFKSTPDLAFGGYDWDTYGTGTVTIYATYVGGVEGNTTDVSDPNTWITEGAGFDPTGWSFVEDNGYPVTQLDTAHPVTVVGSPEYFDPKHEDTPTSTLTDENWGTVDPNTLQASKDAGITWTLVDRRTVEVPLPPTLTTITVVDAKAYDVTTPAKSVVTSCPPQASSLAHTGTNIDEAAELAGAFLLLGGALVVFRMAKGRRKAHANK